jgi:hypothetical protein
MQSLPAYLSNERRIHGNYIAFFSRQVVNIFEWLTELWLWYAKIVIIQTHQKWPQVFTPTWTYWSLSFSVIVGTSIQREKIHKSTFQLVNLSQIKALIKMKCLWNTTSLLPCAIKNQEIKLKDTSHHNARSSSSNGYWIKYNDTDFKLNNFINIVEVEQEQRSSTILWHTFYFT